MRNAVNNTLLARVYDVAVETPLTKAEKLSQALGSPVFLKREDLQPVHSFKIRGAYNKLFSLNQSERLRGVIAASAGNHAQGVAFSAERLGIKATIVMPKTTPSIKVDAVRSKGAKVVLYGDSYSDAYDHAMLLNKQNGEIFIHPFDDPLVISGQGTIGREITEQLPDVTHIFVPVGGGGLIAGIAQFVKQLKPNVKVIGVEPTDSNAMGRSLQAGRRIVLPHVGIFADGVAVKQVGVNTFKVVKQYVDSIITVDNDEICAAIKAVFEDTRNIVEPAGALGVAGVTKYFRATKSNKILPVAICSGANMTFERLQYVAERTLVGSSKEALFSVNMPETPGSLERFCLDVINGHTITEFSYRLKSRKQASIFVGVGIQDQADKQIFIKKMTDFGYIHDDLSYDDLAKEHIRYMIGGISPDAKNEQFYEVIFPERAGALSEFLGLAANEWNISSFHYRGQGADNGSVLIGFEIDNVKTLESKLTKSGYDFKNLDSKALDVFLKTPN